MQITEAGKKQVASLAFALEIREYLSKLHAAGAQDDFGQGAAISVIAWVMTGHDINRPPAAEELLELVNFVNCNAAQVNAAADACLENLVKNDCGPVVN
jgi:hypothetical protein